MTTTTQRPTATAERLAALIELARERDDEPNLDYPELVVLLEAEARRRQQRRCVILTSSLATISAVREATALRAVDSGCEHIVNGEDDQMSAFSSDKRQQPNCEPIPVPQRQVKVTPLPLQSPREITSLIADDAFWARYEEREFGRLALEADHLFDASYSWTN